MKNKQTQERVRLPKIQRSEAKTRMAMFKKSLRINAAAVVTQEQERERVKQVESRASGAEKPLFPSQRGRSAEPPAAFRIPIAIWVCRRYRQILVVPLLPNSSARAPALTVKRGQNRFRAQAKKKKKNMSFSKRATGNCCVFCFYGLTCFLKAFVFWFSLALRKKRGRKTNVCINTRNTRTR